MTDVQSRIAALSPEQRARLEARVAALATARRSGRKDAIQPRDRSKPTPLSFAQQREYALERFRPSNNISGALRIVGDTENDVDLNLLSRILTEILSRHEVLRTTVEVIDRTPYAVVHPNRPIPIPVIDITHMDPEAQRLEVRRLYDVEVARPFSLDEPQRMRCTAVKCAPNVYVALISTHHSSSDGWSMAVVFKEVAQLYPMLREGRAPDLPMPPIQYGDFAAWQRENLGEEFMAGEVAYWKEVLDGIPPRLALPTDRPYPARRTYAGHHHTSALSREATEALERLAEREGVSVSMIMLAASSTVLYRYTQQEDLVFGAAITGRIRSETEDVVGCFANALPLRIQVDRSQTLLEVLRRSRDVVAAAFDHQNLPFDRLVEELAPNEAAQTPLIQMMINVLSAPGSVLRVIGQVWEVPGVRVSPEVMDPGPIPIDIILMVQATEGRIYLQWHYSTELFDHETIVKLARQAERVLDRLVNSPDMRVGDTDLLEIAGSAAVPAQVRREPGFLELFQRQVAQAPDAPAVRHHGDVTSYGELNRRANRLAHHLRDLGVGPDSVVGIRMGRSPLLAATALGVIKAGGAFLTLDDDQPTDRIEFVFSEAQLAPVVEGAGPDHDPAEPPAPGAAAYVVQPADTVIEHRALLASARETAGRLQLGAGDRFLPFDASDFFPVWLAGGTVVLPADADLAAVVRRERVSVLALPAARWNEWVREVDEAGAGLPGSLRLVIAGGGRLLPERLAAWQKLRVPLMHAYGAAGTAGRATFFRLPTKAAEEVLRNLPIGTALPCVEPHILDAALKPVPAGEVGELYLGGVNVGRGHLGRPGRTAGRFVADPDPAHPGARLYRTGDPVRQRADGKLELVDGAG